MAAYFFACPPMAVPFTHNFWAKAMAPAPTALSMFLHRISAFPAGGSEVFAQISGFSTTPAREQSELH